MPQIVTSLLTSPPFLIWLGLGAILLAAEHPTATGWLLAPSMSAFMMAALRLLGVELGWPGQLMAYAAATIVLTLIARWARPRIFAGATAAHVDINDRTSALIGKTGLAVSPFSEGRGRVLVDGAEWDAESETGDAPPAGGKVEVVRVLGGAKLAVRTV